MRVKATLINFKSKLSKSCSRFVSFIRFRVKRSLFIRPLRRARHGNVKARHLHNRPKKPISSSSSFLSCIYLFSTNKDPEMSQTKPRSSSYSVKDDDSLKLMHSPLTPASAKKLFTTPITTPVSAKRTKKWLSSRDTFEDSAVEEACRSFENYLIQLIAEEGKIDDLMDIEELLSCWKDLKSPVFIELVSRFYGELCRDLFSD
ncbi:Transcription repressor OFP17 [Hirschfeldia incana]|nr:Transcription repressor OFP17 [Hirschfeldia incana]